MAEREREARQENATAEDDGEQEISFVDESKITYNVEDDGFSSLGEESDDAAEAEAI